MEKKLLKPLAVLHAICGLTAWGKPKLPLSPSPVCDRIYTCME
ncbi:hypothetical protein ACFLS1_08870 [Verrucomicrobiota bacterium]